MPLSDCSVKELTASFSISQHLRELRSARLVALKKVGWNIDTGLRTILCEKCLIGQRNTDVFSIPLGAHGLSLLPSRMQSGSLADKDADKDKVADIVAVKGSEPDPGWPFRIL
jgi:hypothetical protein